MKMLSAKEHLQKKHPYMKLHWNQSNIDDNWVTEEMEEYAKIAIELYKLNHP